MSFLDIIQSYVIKGIIILIIIQIMLTLQGILFQQTESSVLEQEMFTLSSIFSADIRCVGSDTVSVKPYFLVADSNSTTFLIADSNSFGTPVQINYYLTKPQNTYILNRSVNSGPAISVGRNLTRFCISYFDYAGSALTSLPLSSTDRSNIKSISIIAKMGKSIPVNDTVYTTWESRFYPQNL